MRTFLLARGAADALALCSVSLCAQSNYEWGWSYSGDGVTASGTFETVGPATSFEEIVSMEGTRNGGVIDGIVAPGADPFFIYDNQFMYANGAGNFSLNGVVYDVQGLGHVNFGQEDPGVGYEIANFGGDVTVIDPVTLSVTPLGPVPEPATGALLVLGLTAIAAGSRRRWAARP